MTDDKSEGIVKKIKRGLVISVALLSSMVALLAISSTFPLWEEAISLVVSITSGPSLPLGGGLALSASGVFATLLGLVAVGIVAGIVSVVVWNVQKIMSHESSSRGEGYLAPVPDAQVPTPHGSPSSLAGTPTLPPVARGVEIGTSRIEGSREKRVHFAEQQCDSAATHLPLR